MPSRADQIADRRRTWFGWCQELGLDEDAQRTIAARFIPENHPLRFGPDGDVSRRALFADSRIFAAAHKYLNSLSQQRRHGHRRRDGGNPSVASKRQIKYAFILGRELGWSLGGDDDLRYRLSRWAARMTGDGAPRIAVWIENLSAAQMSKVIRGLRALLNDQNKKKEAGC